MENGVSGGADGGDVLRHADDHLSTRLTPGRTVARTRPAGHNTGVSGPAAPVVDELPLAVLVESFEAATLPLARFHHREHMRVALCYLSRESETDATARMREGLARFLAHHGIEGYHETLTVFWMKRLAARFAVTDPALPLDERIDAVIAGCVNDAADLGCIAAPPALAPRRRRRAGCRRIGGRMDF